MQNAPMNAPVSLQRASPERNAARRATSFGDDGHARRAFGRTTRWSLDAASPGELPGLETLFAEDGAPLRRPEGHGRLLPAGRTGGHRFHSFAGGSGASGPGGALALARLAPLRLVLEVLVGEKLLLARRPDELRAAVHAPEDPVLELHRSLPRRGRSLLQLAPELLAITLSCECLLRPPLVTGFQIEGVLLDIFDDVFLLNLPLEPAESALNRFALLNLHFSHANTPPSRVA